MILYLINVGLLQREKNMLEFETKQKTKSYCSKIDGFI